MEWAEGMDREGDEEVGPGCIRWLETRDAEHRLKLGNLATEVKASADHVRTATLQRLVA